MEGHIVTGDALHTQRETAKAIVEHGGDYLLQVKGNQPSLHEKVEKRIAAQGSPFFAKTKKDMGASNNAS